MDVGSFAVRRRLSSFGLILAGTTLLIGLLAAPALAQGPGLPRTYSIQRIDSQSPILAGGWGLVTPPVGDVNGDGEEDFATNQTQGTPGNEGRVWVFSGENGTLIGAFNAPDLGNPGAVANNNRALVDRFMDRYADIGSCPAGTAAGQTCASQTIGAPDGKADFLVGAEGIDVGGVRDVGRVYVIDGGTLSVLKRIDMPAGDRATLAARQAQFPLPATNVSGGFGRTAVSPRGLPVCQGNGGVVACPSLAEMPAAVRIGDTDAGGQPDVVIGANRFTEIGSTAHPESHCALQSNPNGICHDAGRVYIYRGEEIAGSNPAEILDGSGAGETAPKILRNLGAQADGDNTTFTRQEIFGHAQFPIGDVGTCRSGTGGFPVVNPGDRCSTAARTNVQDGKPDMVISAHRATGPFGNPDPSRYAEGFSFLVDGATGAFLHVYHHPEPQPNALFGYTTRQTFALGNVFGSVLPDLVQGAFQNAQGKTQAGRLYLINGDPNAGFPIIQVLDDPTPTTNERFGIAREGVGDLVPGNVGPEMLVGVFPSNTGLPDAATDIHFMNAVGDQELQRITDPDKQLSSNFGYQITPLGDLNEDGFLDFATAAPNWDSAGTGGAQGITDQGRIYIFRSDNSPATTPPTRTYPTPPGTPPITGGLSQAGDLPGCGAGKRTLRLTAGNDTRNGTTGADLIFAGAGNDIIDALAGDDCVDLGLGNDRGQGAGGKDLILGSGGNDRILGNDDNDTLRGGDGVDNVQGGLGDDVLHGQGGNDTVAGSRGLDAINGGAGRDRISGGSSADRVRGDAGNDRITGNSGNDNLSGDSGNDRIDGGSGRDRIRCGRGRDTVIADARDRVARDCERVRHRR